MAMTGSVDTIERPDLDRLAELIAERVNAQLCEVAQIVEARELAPTTNHPERRRLALTRIEAARSLGVSVDFFDEHIAPELRTVRRGRLRLYPVRELERWLDANAARVLDQR
jgi:hypothetical protein